MIILAIYLILFKGYSVIRFEDHEIHNNKNKKYGSCSSSLGYNYGHNGEWGVGDTAVKAVINAYKNSK